MSPALEYAATLIAIVALLIAVAHIASVLIERAIRLFNNEDDTQ